MTQVKFAVFRAEWTTISSDWLLIKLYGINRIQLSTCATVDSERCSGAKISCQAYEAEVDVEGLTVYIIGVEDIIIDRLAALVHWNSLRDGEWAEEMLALHLDRIDLPYLKKRAKEEDTYDALENILVNSDNG